MFASELDYTRVEITENDNHTNLSHYRIIMTVKNIKVYTRHSTAIIKFVL